MRRVETGPFKFEIGDEVSCKLVGGPHRAWIQETGWSDELQRKNPDWPQTGSRVKVYRVADLSYVQCWYSEVYLERISPLQLLAEQAE
jgi:hypothetical protein